MTVPSQWVIVQQRRLRLSSGFTALASHSQDTSCLALIGDCNLVCQTLKVGRVIEVGPVSLALENFEQAPDIFRQWMEMVGIGLGDWPETPPAEGTPTDVFWKMMLQDSVELDAPEPPFYRRPDSNDYAQLRNMWQLVTGPIGKFITSRLSLSIQSHDDLMVMAPGFIYHIFVCIWHRRLIRSDAGHIGLATEETKPEDEIYIPLGSPVPFILLKTNTVLQSRTMGPITQFSVIRDTYIANAMFGEAFGTKTDTDFETIALC
jgi:hypothetical protein